MVELGQAALERALVGRVLTIFAQDVAATRDELLLEFGSFSPLPAVVTLSWQSAPSLSREIDQMVDAMAEAALQLWPRWHASVEARFERDNWSSADVGKGLDEARAICPDVSAAWFRPAWEKSAKGKAPRLKRTSSAEQVRQLALAIDPSSPYVMLSVSDEDATTTHQKQIAGAAEWLAASGDLTGFLVVPAAWAGSNELDHVTYRSLIWPPESDAIPEAQPALRGEPSNRPVVEVHPTLGRPHPGSAAEQKLASFLQRDEELAPLFHWNQLLRGVGQGSYTVDALWTAGKLVLELDGADHRAPGKYAADRLRDYYLLLAGYLTLRLTNEAVLQDTELAVERIRNVVRHCRMEGRVS